MNNRIKELEPQCWEHNEFGLNFNYQKFAELIIRECAGIAHGSDQPSVDIKYYFGVEE
jgi:hypothetical protein